MIWSYLWFVFDILPLELRLFSLLMSLQWLPSIPSAKCKAFEFIMFFSMMRNITDILGCLPYPGVGNWQLLFPLAADLNQLPAALWVPHTHTLATRSKKTQIPETLRYWEWLFELAYSVFFIKIVFLWKLLTSSRYKQANKVPLLWWIKNRRTIEW